MKMPLVVALLALGGIVIVAQSESSKGNPEKGGATYTRVGCYQCPGRVAKGSPATGPRLGPDPIPYAAFAEWVRRPRGDMPPYTTRVLSDADLADIYAFVVSRPKPVHAER